MRLTVPSTKCHEIPSRLCVEQLLWTRSYTDMILNGYRLMLFPTFNNEFQVHMISNSEVTERVPLELVSFVIISYRPTFE